VKNLAFIHLFAAIGERCPFTINVGEFHSFTTPAFASMLSEVRKYGVAVTLAH
jgi:hypothetical protein